MSTASLEDEKTMMQKIASGSEAAFEKVFKTYYSPLTGYAFNILKNEEQAQEVVQETFVKFWEKRAEINIELSLKAYLFRAVFNRCMNVKKHEDVKLNYQNSVDKNEVQNDGAMLSWELQEQLNKALQHLPEKCRVIFEKAKLEGLKYSEIAEELGISIKTVENQMGKALQIMRVQLKDYLVIMLVLWMHNH